jgi:hypothetical protein
VSEQFLQRAAARFAGCSFLRYGLLDIEDEAHLRAYRQSCDVLIAANVVHATRDMRQTLQRVRDLVAPDGTAILLETTQALAWHEVTTGLLEGWQKSSGTLRSGATLMQPAAWNDALREAGFVAVAQAPESGSPAEAAGLHVFLAQAPAGDLATETPGLSAEISTWNPAVAVSAGENESAAGTAERLAEYPPAERREIVLGIVLEEVAHVLQIPSPGAVRRRDRLMEIGLDSLMALDLSRRLATRVGLEEMPATLMFDYPTPEAIADYIIRRMGQGEGSSLEAQVVVTGESVRLTAEEVDEMPDEAVAELLRSRLER